MTVFNLIYGLVDPRTLLVRYVGLSSIGLKRARQHRMPGRLRRNSHKNNWIKLLFAAGFNYKIVVLEESPVDLKVAERFWIAYGRACGWPLTNLTDGGDGANGWKHTPESKAKLAAARRGKPRSQATRERLSAIKIGRTTAVNFTFKGRTHDGAARQRIGDASRARWQARKQREEVF